MKPGQGSEAAYSVVAKKIENGPTDYRVEKTYAAAPKTLTPVEGGAEKVLKVFKTEKEAKQYMEKLIETQKSGASKAESTAPTAKKS